MPLWVQFQHEAQTGPGHQLVVLSQKIPPDGQSGRRGGGDDVERCGGIGRPCSLWILLTLSWRSAGKVPMEFGTWNQCKVTSQEADIEHGGVSADTITPIFLINNDTLERKSQNDWPAHSKSWTGTNQLENTQFKSNLSSNGTSDFVVRLRHSIS